MYIQHSMLPQTFSYVSWLQDQSMHKRQKVYTDFVDEATCDYTKCVVHKKLCWYCIVDVDTKALPSRTGLMGNILRQSFAMHQVEENSYMCQCEKLTSVQEYSQIFYRESHLSAGAVKRVGRCDAYATEFDLEAEEYVPLPKVSIPAVQYSELCSHICWCWLAHAMLFHSKLPT